ncbi:MAG: four helix bundle protein [Bacteroidales bacterium]
MKLEDLTIYEMSIDISNKIWNEVIKWDSFPKNTIGWQLVRAADSIVANISEAFGRYHFKEQKQFLYYARGSLYETKTFIRMSNSRHLINNETHSLLKNELESLARKLNSFINTVGKMSTDQ